ncbi:hypothetical protein ZWY2020_053446 [Hordeum vulgare]|nr:hypothetical protein ZWY2020_053446 [Hordeum vulgare]
MDRYQRVERPRPESAIAENEIRITAQGLIRNYVSYATSLLQDRKIKEIVLKAMGQAISKSVAVTEIIKKRVPGLYQDTNISSVSITDVWEPIEEGLVPLEMTRHVSMISITLSPVELDQNSPGYQSPTYVDQPRQQQRLQQAPPPMRQPRQQPSDYEDSYVGMVVDMATTKADKETTKKMVDITEDGVVCVEEAIGVTVGDMNAAGVVALQVVGDTKFFAHDY